MCVQCQRAAVLARLKASTDGIAAVEFAYLAPIMLLIFAGAFELSRAIGVDRRFHHHGHDGRPRLAREGRGPESSTG